LARGVWGGGVGGAATDGQGQRLDNDCSGFFADNVPEAEKFMELFDTPAVMKLVGTFFAY